MKTTLLLLSIMINTALLAQWTTSSNGITGQYTVNAVHFINENTGFAGGSDNIFAGNGVISKTTNGGASWTTVKTVTGEPFYDIYFVSPNVGFAVGENGLIAKTTNGGSSWSTQNFTDTSSGLQEPLNSVYFVDANNGYIAGGYNDQWLLKTTDGGSNWAITPLPASLFQRLYGVHFTSVDTGYAVGGDLFSGGKGRVYYTTDGAGTWDTLSIGGMTAYFNDIHFTSTDTGFIGGWDGVILRTTNKGQTWTQQTNQDPDSTEIGEFSFLNSSLGYACTLSGIIIKTTNGGSTWSVDGDVSGTLISLYSISVISPSFGISVGLSTLFAKKSIGTGLEKVIAENSFSVYPNPSSGHINIKNLTKNVTNGQISIVDIQGREVFTKTLNGQQLNEVNLEGLENGMYIVYIRTNEGLTREKLLIDRM